MKIKKPLLIASGFVLLGIGIIGVAVPILPTTPFILLSAFCFSGSSSRFSRLIQKSPFFSSYIEHYKNKTGIPVSVKVQGIVFLWATLLLSMQFFQRPILFILLPIVGACVTVHLLLMKTKK